MPYRVAYRPSKERPGEPWVKLDERGRIVSRHRTKAKALASIRAYYAHLHQHYLVNARPSNPILGDPTRTLMIRQRFVREIRKAFREVAREVRDFMVEKDALGLKERKVFAFNVMPREFEFREDPQKLEAFQNWFSRVVDAKILSPDPDTPPGEPWTTEYVRSSYRRGQLNAFLASRSLTGSDQTAESFLQSSFGQPETMSKIRLLGTRAYQDLRGVTDAMASDMNRILASGLAEGRPPEEIARTMTNIIGSLARSRASTIARTEIIYAHAEGQLDAFSRLGISRLGIKAEWSTAGDDRVCPLCLPLEGQTFEIDEARGMIPLHPNCRCSWIPAEQDLPVPVPEEMRPVSDEFKRELQSILDRYSEAIDALDPFDSDSEDRLADLVSARRREIHDLLVRSRPGGRYEGEVFRRMAPEAKRVVEPAEDWLRDVLHADLFKGKKAKVNLISGRSYYDTKEALLSVSGETRSIIHEYGHHLQRNSSVMEAEKAFLRRRAKVNRRSKLVSVTPGLENEVGFLGDFVSRGGHSYTGRVYGARRTPDGDWDWKWGEVMPMGLERLYRDPGKFASDDPDYFFWLLETLWRRP